MHSGRRPGKGGCGRKRDDAHSRTMVPRDGVHALGSESRLGTHRRGRSLDGLRSLASVRRVRAKTGSLLPKLRPFFEFRLDRRQDFAIGSQTTLCLAPLRILLRLTAGLSPRKAEDSTMRESLSRNTVCRENRGLCVETSRSGGDARPTHIRIVPEPREFAPFHDEFSRAARPRPSGREVGATSATLWYGIHGASRPARSRR